MARWRQLRPTRARVNASRASELRPIALALRAMGKTVHLANLTFTYLGATEATNVRPGVTRCARYSVTSATFRKAPRRVVERQQLPDVVHAIEKRGLAQERTPGRESIVRVSIADATRGAFGDHRSIARMRASTSEPFINPLMALVWSFDLDAVAQRVLYAMRLRGRNRSSRSRRPSRPFRHGT